MPTTNFTTWSAAFRGPHLIESGADTEIQCPVYLNGALVAPSVGTVVVHKPDGTQLVSGSVTVTGSIATYTVLASSLASLTPGDGWRVEWVLTLSGKQHIFRNEAALVLRRLYPSVADQDLYRRHGELSRRLPSGRTNWHEQIEEAWWTIENRMVATGKRPWLILSPSALREPLIYLTLSIIFQELSEGNPETSDWQSSQDYEEKFNLVWNQITFTTADPSTGNRDKAARSGARPTVWLCGRP